MDSRSTWGSWCKGRTGWLFKLEWLTIRLKKGLVGRLVYRSLWDRVKAKAAPKHRVRNINIMISRVRDSSRGSAVNSSLERPDIRVNSWQILRK